MKNKIVFAFILASLIPLCACHFSNDDGNSSFSALFLLNGIGPVPGAQQTIQAEYEGSTFNCYVPPSAGRIKITNTAAASGKGVYLAKVNNSYAYSIPYSELRYVVNTDGIDNAVSSYAGDMSFSGDASMQLYGSKTECRTPYLEKFLVGSEPPVYDSSDVLPRSYDGSTLTNGSTRKFYIQDDSIVRHELKFKVLAIDHDSKIIIWGRDSSDGKSFSASESEFENKTINIGGATSWPQYYLKYFKDIYNLDRTLFGEEAEITGSDLYGYLSLVFFDMYSWNINARGYFWSVDYYQHTETPGTNGYWSNYSKCLYINTDPAVNTDEGSNIIPADTYQMITGTMAHEFMHMIQYNQKKLRQGIVCTTAFGEMMGEIAKDSIVAYLNPDRNQTVWSRFINFNNSYTAVGTTGYSTNPIYYATNFSFGAWLCRNFGGVRLARDFIQNRYNSDDAIVHAVNSINGTNYTMEDLIRLYVTAMTVADSSYQYKMNKSSAPQNSIVCRGNLLSSGTDYSYPLKAINIFDLTATLGKDLRGYILNSGPILYDAFVQLPKLGSLPPYHGIQLCKIGTVQSGASSIEIEFNENGSDLLQMYVIIGDSRYIESRH